MAEKEATRVAYGNKLAELGENNDFYVLDADLSGSTQTAIFAKKFPDRFFNCGIAEENMISVAAGIAATGTPAFASSFAMFACGRAFEQIRNSVAYPHFNVKLANQLINRLKPFIQLGSYGVWHAFKKPSHRSVMLKKKLGIMICLFLLFLLCRYLLLLFIPFGIFSFFFLFFLHLYNLS